MKFYKLPENLWTGHAGLIILPPAKLLALASLLAVKAKTSLRTSYPVINC
jgi:hypothetical protein